MTDNTAELHSLRDALAEIPGDVSSSMAQPPSPKEIYASPDHARALDPERSLVVGARGMGKSFWAGAYTSEPARHALAKIYPRLGLESIGVSAGFTGEIQGDVLSPRVIGELLDSDLRSDDIWRAVLSNAIASVSGDPVNGTSWRDRVQAARNVEKTESALLQADHTLATRGTRLVVVFDALDRLANNWPQIRELCRSLLRTALEYRVFRGIRLKIFMRPDQFDDASVFTFPDASKLKAQAVRLEWHRRDLYGLLFTYLARSPFSEKAFESLAQSEHIILDMIDGLPTIPSRLREDMGEQEKLLSRIAGKYMGADHRKGRTYTWLPNHLMDANAEVSPRSFLRALQEAARYLPAPTRLAIDPSGIRTGIQAASQIRFNQLREDYPWVELALQPLADQRVPCEERDFIQRWRAGKTVTLIKEDVAKRSVLGPVELEDRSTSPEGAILDALIRLGVVERRQDGRINMPDIYRVAAQLLRKGGVPPRRR